MRIHERADLMNRLTSKFILADSNMNGSLIPPTKYGGERLIGEHPTELNLRELPLMVISALLAATVNLTVCHSAWFTIGVDSVSERSPHRYLKFNWNRSEGYQLENLQSGQESRITQVMSSEVGTKHCNNTGKSFLTHAEIKSNVKLWNYSSEIWHSSKDDLAIEETTKITTPVRILKVLEYISSIKAIWLTKALLLTFISLILGLWVEKCVTISANRLLWVGGLMEGVYKY